MKTMTLNFSKCKTKEDVENIFAKDKKQLKMVKDFRKKVQQR